VDAERWAALARLPGAVGDGRMYYFNIVGEHRRSLDLGVYEYVCGHRRDVIELGER
jgi:hypothetical protein